MVPVEMCLSNWRRILQVYVGRMSGTGLEKMSLAESVKRYKGPDVAKEYLFAPLTHPRVRPDDACR